MVSFNCQGKYTMHKDLNETGIEHWKVSTVQRNENRCRLKKLMQNEVKLE